MKVPKPAVATARPRGSKDFCHKDMRHYGRAGLRKHAAARTAHTCRAEADLRSELPDRIEIEGRVAWIFADPDRRVIDEMIRRQRQIVRRRHAGKDAAGRIVFGAVTGTEI